MSAACPAGWYETHSPLLDKERTEDNLVFVCRPLSLAVRSGGGVALFAGGACCSSSGMCSGTAAPPAPPHIVRLLPLLFWSYLPSPSGCRNPCRGEQCSTLHRWSNSENTASKIDFPAFGPKGLARTTEICYTQDQIPFQNYRKRRATI